MPITGASYSLFLSRPVDRALEHLDQRLDGILALDVLLVAVPPQLELHDLRFDQVGRIPRVELDDAGADVGAANIDSEDAVVAFEHPRRQQVRGAEQARLVGVVADQLQLDLDARPP